VERTRKRELHDILVIAICSVICGAEGETTTERRYFIGSFEGQCAQEFGVLARNHWSVENNLHWMLDVAFGEDDSRVRRIALMLLKHEKTAKVGVKARCKKAGWDRNHLLKVVQGHLMRLPCRAEARERTGA
jgi:predicted transposase YbfD/YdcC